MNVFERGFVAIILGVGLGVLVGFLTKDPNLGVQTSTIISFVYMATSDDS